MEVEALQRVEAELRWCSTAQCVAIISSELFGRPKRTNAPVLTNHSHEME